MKQRRPSRPKKPPGRSRYDETDWSAYEPVNGNVTEERWPGTEPLPPTNRTSYGEPLRSVYKYAFHPSWRSK